MFELGWGELFFIGIVALLVLGPDEFPRALKSMGEWIKKLKDAATSMQTQVQDAIKDVDAGIGLDAIKPATLMEPLKDIEFFGDDLAKAWNADILNKEVAVVETPSPLMGEGAPIGADEGEKENPSPGATRHPLPQGEREVTPKPRMRVKARRRKQGKAIETMEVEG